MSRHAIRVLLVDDHEVVRNGVRLMLGTADDVVVAGEAGSAEEALAQAHAGDFDVALVDIALPDRSGLDLLRTLRAEKPRLRVLMLSMYAEDVYALRAIKHGAAGYLTKSSTAASLVAAVRKAAAGGKVISPQLVEQFAQLIGGDAGSSHEHLSNRELEVLKRIAEGYSLVDVARALHLSPSTVTTYRARILEKTNLKSNAELTRYALEHGLLL